MRFLIQHYLNLIQLKTRPQDCPVSNQLQLTLVILYLLISIINAQALYNFIGGVALSLSNLIYMVFFVYLILIKKPERKHQTLNAMLGAGILISILDTVLSFYFITDKNQASVSGIGSILIFSVFMWAVVVYGHIIRHALDIRLSTGIMITLAYIFINVILIFPVVSRLGA